VRLADLLLLLAAYSQDATGDINGDGATNVEDLLLLLAGYGSDCTRDVGGGGGATCADGGCATSADVSIVVDNSHTSYCNGVLLGSASSWNTPDTWTCDAVTTLPQIVPRASCSR